MKYLVVSPHLDDAVWSIGQTLARLNDATVMTVFAQLPPARLVTDYDRSCGFGSSSEAVSHRRVENTRACTVLGVEHRDGPWLDGQYGTVTTETELADWLHPQLRPGVQVVAPLGIGHHDHRIVGCAARVAARRAGGVLYVYEELPYRVTDPEEAVRCIQELQTQGWVMERSHFDSGGVALKRAAVECYGSQLDDDVRNWLYVPERIWRAEWHGS